jgi:hypothetical protein
VAVVVVATWEAAELVAAVLVESTVAELVLQTLAAAVVVAITMLEHLVVRELLF